MINSIFFAISIVYIINEIYYIKNKSLLDSKFRDRELGSFSFVDVMYYIIRVSNWTWLIIGCFSSFHVYFIFMISLSLLKFIVYPFNRNIYKLYDTLVSIVSIISMILLIFDKFM